MSSVEHVDWKSMIGPVAMELLGQPNQSLSSRDELRWGARGSLSVTPSKGVFFDHECGRGGGVIDLVMRERRVDRSGAIQILRDGGHIPARSGRKSFGEIVTEYSYTDAGGALLFQVCRLDPKGFRQRRPDGNGGWIWTMKGVPRTIYRLPAVIAAVKEGHPIYVAEGEKGVGALESIGVVGTCSPGGAGKFQPEYASHFAGADVVVLADNDEPGRKHAEQVALALSGVAARVRVVDLPELPPKGDIADWIRAGGTAAQLAELVAATPTWSDDAPQKVAFPVIQLVAGELHNAATAAEDALIKSGLPILQRGDTLVRPISREVPASRGRTTIAAGLGELGVPALLDVLCQCAEWQRFDGRSEEFVRVNPPAQVAQILLARHGQWRLPPIRGVITTPTLRSDGSLLSAAGYDRSTRLFHVMDPALQMRPEVHRPTRRDAVEALSVLCNLLAEFPFAPEEVSVSVALSGIITPVVRGALSVAPLHLFKANTAGSGKSYLVDIVSAVVAGRACPVISAAPDEAETEKRIAGLLLAGYPLISIDNVNGELGGDLLCQAVERPLVRLRRLGGSDIIEIESSATIFATGNNSRVRGDMVRRTLIAGLDAGQERPELRTFKANPVATVLADRGLYVSAVLTIVGAYIAAGLPDCPPPLGSFEDWSTIVRGSLLWLGCADPVGSMETARRDDPELTELREMLAAWHSAFGADAVTTAHLAKTVEQRAPTHCGEPTDFLYPQLREALLRMFGERGVVNTRRLGRWLSDREGRIVGGRRFMRAAAAAADGIVRWRVEESR